jgi:hypothetical protein
MGVLNEKRCKKKLLGLLLKKKLLGLLIKREGLKGNRRFPLP